MDLAAALGACFCAKALRLQRVSRVFCEASARRALPTTIWTEMQSQVSSVKTGNHENDKDTLQHSSRSDYSDLGHLDYDIK